MNAITSNRPIVARGSTDSLAAGLRDSVGAGLAFWPLLAILTTFWIYVTLSNVLYATSMQASFASMSPGRYFAPWDERVLQHVFLYPILIVCVLGSLRVGWTPMWRTVPLQIALGLLFSFLASPAMVSVRIADRQHGRLATFRALHVVRFRQGTRLGHVARQCNQLRVDLRLLPRAGHRISGCTNGSATRSSVRPPSSER